MAYSDLISALRLPGHPLARSGYGKRSVAPQEPHQQQNFAHLPVREGYLAAFIDRLPEGSAMDTKTLAKAQPLYGQQAVRSALRHLSEAGHLRRIRETEGINGSPRWVQRTYFSAVARDDAWWAAYLADGAPQEVPRTPPQQLPLPPLPSSPPEPPSGEAPAESEPETEELSGDPVEEPVGDPVEDTAPADAVPAADRVGGTGGAVPVARTAKAPVSAAYQALVALAMAEPRLTLSSAECSALEGLAAEWFARGISLHQFILTLTAGLPQVVHNAGALTRTRLINKMPPELVWLPQPEPPLPPQRERTMECIDCRRPGRTAALPGGLCADCRSDASARAAHASARPLADELRTRVAGLRSALRSGTSGAVAATAGS
jgi:hypothetical protein